MFSTSAPRHADFTHAVSDQVSHWTSGLADEGFHSKVIGAGVVGLAIARQLAGRDGTSTVLVEKHGAVGTETSSRNSEVGLSIPYHIGKN